MQASLITAQGILDESLPLPDEPVAEYEARVQEHGSQQLELEEQGRVSREAQQRAADAWENPTQYNQQVVRSAPIPQEAVERPQDEGQPPHDVYGYGVHSHAHRVGVDGLPEGLARGAVEGLRQGGLVQGLGGARHDPRY